MVQYQRKSLRQRALDYLGKREYSYAELLAKLKPYAEAERLLKKAQLDDDEAPAGLNQQSLGTHYSHDEAYERATATEEIKVILDDFKTRGWLSDARFTEQVVYARKAKFGSARVANELREKGVAEDLIDDAIAVLKASEYDQALAICRKKYRETPKSREDWARQARFLQSRGFGFDVIKKVLNTTQDSDG